MAKGSLLDSPTGGILSADRAKTDPLTFQSGMGTSRKLRLDAYPPFTIWGTHRAFLYHPNPL